MTLDMHRRFASLRHRLGDADRNFAHVFVPVGPPETAPVRLLFVGQATRGWVAPCLAPYRRAWTEAAKLIASPPSRSGFWQVIKRIVAGVSARIGADGLDDRAKEVAIGWSNLVKVGHPRRNPGRSSWRLQASLCVEQLRHELRVMRPSAVVLMTRDFASEEILLPVFGRTEWENDVPEKDRVAWKLSPSPVIWMNHPRSMGPAGYREASVELAVRIIAGHLSSQVDRKISW